MSDFDPGPEWREVSYVEYRDAGVPADQTATSRVGDQDPRYFLREAPAPPPLPLPTEPGAVITWREDNDAGRDVSVFAERQDDGRWRVNGFDLEDEDWVRIEVRAKSWTRLEPPAVTAKAVLDRVRQTATWQIVLLANPKNGDQLDKVGREFGVSS